MLGYVSRRVLGQYDAFLPPDDEGLLYLVGPNVAEVEARFGLPPRDFRLWIAVHEVTHRVQFGTAPWLRGHIRAQVDRYLGTISLESKDFAAQVRRAVDEARSGADVRGMGGLFLLLNDEQRAIVRHVQGVMSLLEGHASYVMNEVSRDASATSTGCARPSPSADGRPAAWSARSSARSASTRRSSSTTPARSSSATSSSGRGCDGFNRVWLAQALPSVEEIAEPAAWVARVAGS